MNNVYIKQNALNNLKDYLDLNLKTLIVTDDLVPTIYIDSVKKQLNQAYVVTIKHGEHHKTFESYQLVMDHLLKEEFTRHDQIIALGGGIVSDLTGFVASTYKRGIRFINIPTTTLAMIDASVGGKTAINYQGIKNVIGAFYDAEAVIIDSTVLKTLPIRHFYNGLVEALKMGLCLDKSLYDLFLEDDYLNKIDLIIEKAVLAKLKIVEQDHNELNVRKVLNFGHTIGHAIEAANLDQIYHGEAVGIGMLFAIQNEQLKQEVKDILTKMNIKWQIDLKDTDKLLKLIANDKKKNAQMVDFVFLNAIENFTISPISMDKIKDLLMRW